MNNASLTEKIQAFNPSLPLEQAHTIPACWYRDADLYEAERSTVFSGSWLAVGRREEVASAGSYLTIDVAGEPILVVRDEQGVLRAFSNVCRHRAALVMTEPCGHATRLRCRYHGWTYDLAGRLRGTPEFDGVADFRREEQGLVALHVAEWGPLVWVHAGESAPPLDDYLDPLSRLIACLGTDRLRFVERRSYDLACNWKVFVDNYLDGGYHVNTVHPGLAGVLDYSRYRTEIGRFASVQISPLDTAGASQTVGKVREGENAYYAWVFPNLMVNVYHGYMDTNLVLPLGPTHCRVVYDFYFDAGRDAEHIAGSIAVAHQIQLEDGDICEEVQRGLASRTYKAGRYSARREGPVYAFHQLLAHCLRERLSAP